MSLYDKFAIALTMVCVFFTAYFTHKLFVEEKDGHSVVEKNVQ